MTILLFGKTGQLGRSLQRHIGESHALIAPDRAQVDLRNPAQLRDIIAAVKPSIILNAAAYTNVDLAEREPELCDVVNHRAVAVMAEEARAQGSLLVTYSTDYVFDGAKPAPYTETDPPSPLNVYGRSKLLGERAVQGSGCDALILRTSWLYSGGPGDFVGKILRAAAEKPEIKVADDQIGSLTSADDLADATLRMLASRDGPRGLYHCAASGAASRYEIAAKILEYAGLSDRARLIPVPTRAIPSPAHRPLNSALDCSRLRNDYGIVMPQWNASLKALLLNMKLNR
jgi:dTDP-4-dehydrorhamnose reductase